MQDRKGCTSKAPFMQDMQAAPAKHHSCRIGKVAPAKRYSCRKFQRRRSEGAHIVYEKYINRQARRTAIKFYRGSPARPCH